MCTGVSYKGYFMRKTPAALQAIFKKVKKMRRANLIEENNSPYYTLMIIIPKPYRDKVLH